jgi:hypothetical protein
MKFKVDFAPRSKKRTGFSFEVDTFGPVQAKSLARQMLMEMGENCADYKEPKVKVTGLLWEQQ